MRSKLPLIGGVGVLLAGVVVIAAIRHGRGVATAHADERREHTPVIPPGFKHVVPRHGHGFSSGFIKISKKSC